MTSFIRRLDTPQWMADHERRLKALERGGRAVVTDPPRREVPSAFSDSITVVVMPPNGTNAFGGGYADFPVVFTQILRSSGSALTWAVAQPTIVQVEKAGLYAVSGAIGITVVGGSKGPMEARIKDYGDGVESLAAGSGYCQFDMTVGTSWNLVELKEWSELQLILRHDILLAGGGGATPGDRGNPGQWHTYMTIAKAG